MPDTGIARVETAFARARRQGRAAFMPYYVVGYPDLETSVAVFKALADAGADLIEVGVPFSDPLADGPTNQMAAQIALRNGTTVRDVLDTVARLRAQGVTIPLVLMGYYNPFLAYGVEVLCRDAAAAGADGFIVPDLPPDVRDGEEMRDLCAKHGLAFVPLLAPTSTEARVRVAARAARGFIYLVSVTGITGARDRLPPDLAAFVARVRKHTDLPLAVGFGIARPEHARQVARIADGVVVGSAIVRLGLRDDPVGAVRALAQELAEATEIVETTVAGAEQ